jgi:siroheme synthase-like protein
MKDDVLPVGLKLEGLPCLVVGGGDEAERRAAALVEAGARVRVVSDTVTPALSKLGADGRLELSQRAFADSDFDGVWLAVLSDRDGALAERMGRLAREQRVFFCAVDQPAHSTFSHLALARSGPVTLAVSTNGTAPALSRRLREELERVLGQSRLGEFAERLARLRDRTPSADRKDALGREVAGLRLTGLLEVPAERDGDE